MMTFFLEAILPIVALLIVFLVAKVYLKLQYPKPIVLGCIIPKVCVVPSREILAYNQTNKHEEPTGRRLRSELRRKRFRVNWGYLCQEAWNTSLFQRALRFEKLRIDPRTPGLEYEQREILVLDLLDQAAELRWKQFRWQAAMLLRARLGLAIDTKPCAALLLAYKHLEDEFIALADMAEDNSCRQMLVERLGLSHWGVIDGNSDPEPA